MALGYLQLQLWALLSSVLGLLSSKSASKMAAGVPAFMPLFQPDGRRKEQKRHAFLFFSLLRLFTPHYPELFSSMVLPLPTRTV